MKFGKFSRSFRSSIRTLGANLAQDLCILHSKIGRETCLERLRYMVFVFAVNKK